MLGHHLYTSPNRGRRGRGLAVVFVDHPNQEPAVALGQHNVKSAVFNVKSAVFSSIAHKISNLTPNAGGIGETQC
jgi:hypothetical protein